jgi:hypothetical protein
MCVLIGLHGVTIQKNTICIYIPYIFQILYAYGYEVSGFIKDEKYSPKFEPRSTKIRIRKANTA